ncbi:AMP-dependent synthetase [Ignicoccus islandicus DSM 13165]|uniref:AMP-dependent synthetase n=1 Tax=Ignicoccus islandicus DSM 13165 TaxID=940295 RepID=A0A0U2WLJ7_9CREN|nr:class I adenylate-forming enzyme family protein [Ignicoccus islandicus]ALU11793.1 AMP-dependent synthetase [Ignicoccus islandicus DSM 13165]
MEYKDPGLPVHKLIEKAANAEPEKVALVYEDGTQMTYKELIDKSKAVASLLKENGVNKGDTTFLIMFNRPEFVTALLGSLYAGARVVIVDALTQKEDLEMQLEDSKPKVVIADKEVIEREGATLSNYPVVNEEDLKNASGSHEVEVNYEDDARIFYYAGIAGRTMQVIHTHRSFTGAIMPLVQAEGIEGSDVSLVTIPLTHVLGLDAALMTALVSGGTAILLKRFNIDKIKELSRKFPSTYVVAVPLVFQTLMKEDEGFVKELGRSLKWSMSGGAYLPPQDQQKWEELTGKPLLQVYGMTEAPQIFATTPQKHKIGSLGFPLPGVEALLVDPDTLQKVEDQGELLVRGPQVMKGYPDPQENEKAFVVVDGKKWLRTGDILSRDSEGFYYFKGVRKRMLKYKGYPIFPRDLELILQKHPCVEEVTVEGEPAGDVGQIPVAKVKLKEECKGKVSEEEIMNFVNSKVAAYKKVRKVVFT